MEFRLAPKDAIRTLEKNGASLSNGERTWLSTGNSMPKWSREFNQVWRKEKSHFQIYQNLDHCLPHTDFSEAVTWGCAPANQVLFLGLEKGRNLVPDPWEEWEEVPRLQRYQEARRIINLVGKKETEDPKRNIPVKTGIGEVLYILRLWYHVKGYYKKSIYSSKAMNHTKTLGI